MIFKVSMDTYAQLALQLKGWCQGELLDQAHAVLVLMQEDVSTADIEETMNTVKSLGRVHVRGRILSVLQNRYLVLCECKEAVKRDLIPLDVFPIDGGGPWSVITVVEGQVTSAQSQEASGQQQAEGRPKNDPRPLSQSGEVSANSTEAILYAVSELLGKTKSASDHGSYRRLRTFSGLLPTPAGEEQFDHWLGQA